jgi:GAF domain-containing protein
VCDGPIDAVVDLVVTETMAQVFLRQGHVVRLSRLADLPDEAAVDRQTLERLGTRSAVLVPLVGGGAVAGTLVLGTLRKERHWPDELVPRLRLLAAVFAGALAR